MAGWRFEDQFAVMIPADTNFQQAWHQKLEKMYIHIVICPDLCLSETGITQNLEQHHFPK
jgi:hypothetical protein